MSLEIKINTNIVFIPTLWDWMFFMVGSLCEKEGQQFCITKNAASYGCMHPTEDEDEVAPDSTGHLHMYICHSGKCKYKMYGNGIDDLLLAISTQEREYKNLYLIGFSEKEVADIEYIFTSNDWETMTNCLLNKLEGYHPPLE
jgi:hypothetical protein